MLKLILLGMIGGINCLAFCPEVSRISKSFGDSKRSSPYRFVQELVSNLDQVRRSWFIFAFQVPGIPEWLIQQNLKEFITNALREHAIRKGAFSTEETQIYEAALEKAGY